jgi:hypothetical protein
MSSLSQFTNKQNLKLLWEVLLDELHINISNKSLISNIRTVFESNINPFASRANPKVPIMELNKQFLSQVVLAVNRLFPNMKQEQNIKRITISDEEVSEPYKIEDIHASRQSEFEKEVERKRMEMENYMTPQKPRELDFSDRASDGKIKAMDSLVADKMNQRNLEIEQFQNNNYNSSIDPEKWLTPTETSVKNEKTQIEPKVIEQKPIIKNNQNSRLKHISIDSNNNITLSIDEIEPKNKKVSWDDQESTISIFNKLKKQPIVEVETNINTIKDNIPKNDEKQYMEQKSMPLPQVKQEEIIRNQSTLPTTNNEPIIPKTEIIKQLNEMNKKIDNLYEMIYKLTNLMEKSNNTEVIEIPKEDKAD